jgi:amino acid adenylation domain-containing protein
MKAGGAYLPLDADYPPERLAYMIEDSGCPVIVTTWRLLEELPVTWARIVMIDDDWPAIAGGSSGNPELITLPENLAYMIYTSGSTGKPKGVGLTHQGLCNLNIAQNRNLQVAAGASVLQFASFSFDAATWEWLMTLICGAKLILISGADAQSPEMIPELIVKYDVEAVTLPPSVLSSAAKKRLPALKTMIVAGETCPNELVRQWSGDCRFINAYGPTESTVCATMTEAMVYGEKVSIGRANENTQIYILGRDQEPMPVGITGEIYIAGLGLARGYLNRADETADKFIANPFGEEGRRMYRTGDLGRYHNDGSI